MESLYLARDKRFNKIATIELAIATLFSGGAYILSLPGTTVVLVMCLLAVLFSIVALVRNRFLVKKSHHGLYILVLFALVCISVIKNISSFNITVSGRCLLSMIVAFSVAVTFDNKHTAINAYIKVIYTLSLIALICWIVFVPFGLSYSWMPIIASNSNSNITYSSIILFNLHTSSTRNCGPFWEPSIFAGYIALALALLKLESWSFSDKKKEYIVLISALLSSQSTGGIILLFLFILLCVWVDKGSKGSVAIKLTTIIAVIFVVFGWGVLESLLLEINYSMFSKIFNIAQNGSSLTRLQSFAVDLQIFLSSPIFGVGVDRLETEFLRLRDILATVTGMAHTSTSTEYLAAFGVGGIWINYLWVRGAISFKKNFITSFLFIAIMFIVINESPQISFPLTYYVLFVLIKDIEVMTEEMRVD